MAKKREFIEGDGGVAVAEPSSRPGGYLQGITREVKRRPGSWVLYAGPGWGKTSWAAFAPNVLFLIDDKEDGINTLKASKLVPADVPILPPMASWNDVIGALAELRKAKHEFKVLAIDTLGGMERLLHEFVCGKHYDGNSAKFDAYGRGASSSLPYWNEFLRALDYLRDERGMTILALAHAKVQNHRNPTGDDYDWWVPDLNKMTWGATHKWAEAVLFGDYEVKVENETAKGSGVRILYAETDPAYTAKNRHNLPFSIPMGRCGKDAWHEFIEAIKQAGAA